MKVIVGWYLSLRTYLSFFFGALREVYLPDPDRRGVREELKLKYKAIKKDVLDAEPDEPVKLLESITIFPNGPILKTEYVKGNVRQMASARMARSLALGNHQHGHGPKRGNE